MASLEKIDLTIHIGIVTYNSAKVLPACLTSVHSQSYPHWTLSIWDNNSQDNTLDLISEFNHTIQVYEDKQNLGFGSAHNELIRRARANENDYYLPLNPDVRMEPDYTLKIVDFLQQNSNVGLASGKLLILDNQNAMTQLIYSIGHGLLRGGYGFNIGHMMPEEALSIETREVFGVSGAAPVYSYRLINDISHNGEFFDTAMFMYGEDIDIDWRAKKAGWKCWFIAEAVAHHHVSSPDEKLRAHGIANRYLSTIKNAYVYDLVSYNILLITAHLLFRIIFTPQLGLQIANLLVKNLYQEISRRRSGKISRKQMHEWFRWSLDQPTLQPKTLVGRLESYRRRLRS